MVPGERRSVYRASSPPPSSESHRSMSPTLTGPLAGRELATGLVCGCAIECVDAAIISSPYLHCRCAWGPGRRGAVYPHGPASAGGAAYLFFSHSKSTPVLLPSYGLRGSMHPGPLLQISAHTTWQEPCQPPGRAALPTRQRRCPTKRQGLPRPRSIAHASHSPSIPLNLRAISHSELPCEE